MSQQDLPAETTRSGSFARMLMRAFGSAVSGGATSFTGAFFLGLGDALAGVRATLTRAADQAFVSSATDLLSELEIEYGLAIRPDLTDAQRQARLVAKVRAARAGTPQGIANAIGALVLSNVFIYETLALFASYAGEPRLVYEWAVSIGSAWADPVVRESVLAIVQQMKPAHTRGNVSTNADSPFLTDDPNSLTDRDILNG